MHQEMLGLLRCPFCGTSLSLVDNDALVQQGDRIESGVLGCECCAFPIVAGIPVILADDNTRSAMHALEAGRREEALFTLLGLDEARAGAFRALLARPAKATCREAIAILSPDPEGTYFIYRFSDPTYVMSQAVLRAIGQLRWPVADRVLDVCGGCGHLTRVLAGLKPAGGSGATGTVVADMYFWKLWLAVELIAPGCAPVCCDANQPLPFTRDAFSMLVLSDAFPYIWHKRLLAEEMMRLVVPDGVVVLPHLHSALGENFSAGMTLTPGAYQNLFAPLQPHLFSDEKLLSEVLEHRTIDLMRDVSPAELGTEPSLTLVASRRADLFREYTVPDASDLAGELRVNPLYQVERRDGSSVLTLTFPTSEYEEEFGACKQYLSAQVTVNADLTGAIDPSKVGPEYNELRRRRILIDAPPRYC